MARLTDVVAPPPFSYAGTVHVADEHPDGVLDRSVMADGYYVATVHDTASHDGCWDADARLIAAAPELLTALEEVVAKFDASTDPAVRNTPLGINKARAAIAKAKGGAA